MSVQIPIEIGCKIRHIKRGSDYTVIGQFWNFGGELTDNEGAFVRVDGKGSEIIAASDMTEDDFTKSWLAFAVTVQVSALHPFDVTWVVYRGEAGMFARPLPEFTTDRFERLS